MAADPQPLALPLVQSEGFRRSEVESGFNAWMRPGSRKRRRRAHP